MKQPKCKIASYIQADTADLLEKHYKEQGYTNRSDFVDDAIQFYCGYLSANDYSAYLPNIVISSFWVLAKTERKIGLPSSLCPATILPSQRPSFRFLTSPSPAGLRFAIGLPPHCQFTTLPQKVGNSYSPYPTILLTFSL